MSTFPQDEVDKNSSLDSKLNLNCYFDSSQPTIFDEIVSSQKESFFDTKTDTSVEVTAPSNECHKDAWIPPEETRKILGVVATSCGSHNVDSENLTMPGLTLQEELADPIRNAVVHFIGTEVGQRNSLTISDVTQVNFNKFNNKNIFVLLH